MQARPRGALSPAQSQIGPPVLGLVHLPFTQMRLGMRVPGTSTTINWASFSYSASDYGQSDAEWDPKAFTYFGDKKLLAFPYVNYSSTTGTQSTLEEFSVDTAKGFSKLGSIDHSSFYTKNPYGYCGGYFTPQVRRGVFLEDVAYSISYGGIVAKKVTELANAGVSLALPQPNAYGYPYSYGYADVCYAADEPVATK